MALEQGRTILEAPSMSDPGYDKTLGSLYARLLHFPIAVLDEHDYVTLAACDTSDHFEVSAVLEGEIDLHLGGGVHRIRNGEVVTIGPGVQRRWGSGTPSLGMIGMCFLPALWSGRAQDGQGPDLRNFFKAGSETILQPEPPRLDGLKRELRQLRSEVLVRSTALCALRVSLVLELLADPASAEGDPPAERNWSPQTRVFLQLVEAHFLTRHNVQFYADEMALSPKVLHKHVHADLGRSPKHWINDLLIREAKHRLLHSDEPLKVIAQQLGYADVFQFSKAFKLRTGCAPSEFRKRRY